MYFSEIIKLQFGILLLFKIIVAKLSLKCVVTPNFLFGFP